jgi:plastocyanin
MRALPYFAFALLLSPALLAASLAIDVHNAQGTAVTDAVVYAVPEDHRVPPPKRTAIMDQKNRMFVPHILPVQTGTSVFFPNSDDIRHQVYSFSPAKTFQLPLYKGTPGTPIRFDKAGVVALGCNIHDRMSAYIVVVDTPHFALTGKDGRVELENLSGGSYLVHVWTPAMNEEPAPLPVTLGPSERKTLSVPVRATP